MFLAGVELSMVLTPKDALNGTRDNLEITGA